MRGAQNGLVKINYGKLGLNQVRPRNPVLKCQSWLGKIISRYSGTYFKRKCLILASKHCFEKMINALELLFLKLAPDMIRGARSNCLARDGENKRMRTRPLIGGKREFLCITIGGIPGLTWTVNFLALISEPEILFIWETFLVFLGK